MTYTAYVCETVTGKNLGPLDCKIGTWSRELNGTDTATVSLFPGNPVGGGVTTTNQDWMRLITTPARMTLVIEWTAAPTSYPVIVFAGPIWTRNRIAKRVDFNAAGPRSLMKRRKAITFSQTPTTWQNQVISYSNMSLGSMAVNLLKVATDPLKGGSALPLVYPAIETDADATHVRNYNGYALSNIDQLLTDLTAALNGPDIDLTPSWVDATRQYMQYTVRAGTNEQPYIFGGQQIAFDASVAQSSVKKIALVEDASQMATTQWALGAGNGTGITVSMAQSVALTANGWPLLEQETDYKTVLDQPTLDVHTAGDLAAHNYLPMQFNLTVDATGTPTFGSYTVGDRAKVRVANDYWIPDGDYPMRLVKLSGDSTTSVTMDVQTDATGQ